MKYFKRSASVFLLVVLIAAGCGGSKNSPSPSTQGATFTGTLTVIAQWTADFNFRGLCATNGPLTFTKLVRKTGSPPFTPRS